MKKFEYKSCYVGDKGQLESDLIISGVNETKLNELGKEGWELVNIIKTEEERRTNLTAIFKRELTNKS
jgi:hypothetical protein|tara:strand:- start:47 stop:250 length:204 start_codon:yes stop_codon:yes gene_type:complete